MEPSPPRTVLLVAALALFGIALRYAVFVWIEGSSGLAAYVEAMCVWDCTWYRTIAEEGYDLAPGVRYRTGGANWAFFPLSPLLAGLGARLTGLPVVTIGFLLSNLYATAAVLAARPLFDGNHRAYWLYAAMVLVGPFSFLFSSLHTEALFILLTTLAFVALRKSNYVAAGAAVALLSATRLTGVLLTVAMLIGAVIDHRRAGTSWRELPWRLFGDRRLLLGLALAPVGVIAYMAYLRLHVGDGLGFLHIQRAWGRWLGNPLESLQLLGNTGVWRSAAGMVHASWAVAAILGLLLSAVLVLRRRVPEAIFCALVIAVSLAGGTTSMVRFVAGLAPLGMVVAELLAAPLFIRVAALGASTTAGVVLTVGWLKASLLVM